MASENSRQIATPPLVSTRNDVERRNSILMTRHNPDLGSASDWLKYVVNQTEAHPDLGSDTSSAWYDVISRGNQ